MTDPTGPLPDVSVIVVNYRSAQLTLQALEDAAASAARAGLVVQEIVVDNASGERDVDRFRDERPGATVIKLPENRGFAAGNNAGIARARGRWLLLVNPDAFAQGDALPQLVAYGDAHPAVGVVAPLLRNTDGSIQDNAFRRFPDLGTVFVDFCAPLALLIRGTRLDLQCVPRARLTGPQRIAHATGAALLVRRELAARAGPLDEGFFMYLEETEWQQRISAGGAEIHVVPEASFVHLGGGSSSSSALASPAYLDSLLRYHRHPERLLLVLRTAGGISRISLELAGSLGPRSPRLADLLDSFRRLRRELGTRDRHGDRRAPAPR